MIDSFTVQDFLGSFMVNQAKMLCISDIENDDPTEKWSRYVINNDIEGVTSEYESIVLMPHLMNIEMACILNDYYNELIIVMCSWCPSGIFIAATSKVKKEE